MSISVYTETLVGSIGDTIVTGDNIVILLTLASIANIL